jgi:hypothetical protein
MVDAVSTAVGVLEKHGLPTLFALVLLWMLRADAVVPLVAEHKAFLQAMTVTQNEIAETQKEQAKLIAEIRDLVATRENKK